jgi:aryl-alcohol dehydrogenase-like predicted oxidoreductase
MKYRQLGKAGLAVSEIGFGTWGIGGAKDGSVAYGSTDDATSRAALIRAFDLGVNFYDTSDFYGYGHSEALLGETFKDIRQDVIIASKGGFKAYPDVQDFSVQHMVAAVEASLTRLQTEYIDLYQLHSPSQNDLLQNEDLLIALHHLKDAGKLRSIGISLRSPDDGVAIIDQYDFDVFQFNYNLIDQRAHDNGLLKACAENNIGVIIRTPLCFGFLTGAYTGQNTFDKYDHRSQWSEKQRARWASAYRDFVSALSEENAQTPAQTALKFCLSHEGVSAVIPGMLTTDHVEENVGASGSDLLSDPTLQKIRDIYAGQTFFLGKGE